MLEILTRAIKDIFDKSIFITSPLAYVVETSIVVKRVLLIYLLVVNIMMADDSIEVYECYGNFRHIVIKGRVFDSKSEQNISVEDSKWTNLKHKFHQFFNDEEKYQPITIKIEKNHYEIESDDEGYYSFEATTSNDYFNNKLNIALYANKERTSIECDAFISTRASQIGVISDFDDTIILSGVTNKLDIVNNIFLKNYKQRTLVSEVKEKILKELKESNQAFFVITGSPKQLQKSINNFLDYYNFPKRTVMTKKLNGDNNDPLFDQLEYKYEKIKKLILLYPNIQWVLFGDSGEKDREVYLKIAKAYPKNIKEIYIRNVKTGKIKKIDNDIKDDKRGEF